MLKNKKTIGILAAVFLGLGIAVPLALARMDPLREIKAQIKRPNMLIVFDNSGSMQWNIAGGTIANGMENPDSRMYKAKAVIKNIVPEFKYTVNLGLMTYWQSALQKNFNRGYYPYKVSTAGAPTLTEVTFDYRWLRDHTHFPVPPSSPWGPQTPFVETGITYTLCNLTAAGCSHSFNSRYTREEGWGWWRRRYTTYANFDSSVCTDRDRAGRWTRYCTIGGRSWHYEESYYVYGRVVVSTNYDYFLKYHGTQFTDADGSIGGKAGVSYAYWTFNSYSATCGASDSAASCPVYGPELGYGYGSLIVPINIAATQAAQDATADLILEKMNLANEGGLVASGYKIGRAHV